ncbi:RGCVC family protein [Actinokineospora sp. HUAS TT18]|uniref:RGCVC family protein n=1 Tax=Actinokineospora sp. HUAS TT18 TaxID=3447451 RepID=UPI003F527A61
MTTSEVPANSAPPELPMTDTCAVCPHPWHDHDRVAARYCTATVAGAYSRNCVCGPGVG